MAQASLPYETKDAAARAFTRQSAIFDELYSNNPIIQYKRRRVREHVSAYLKPGSHILELNAGTGEDAAYFAQQGHRVHATDISAGMQQQLQQKMQQQHLATAITTALCSFNELEQLQQRGPYDLIFSNFAGLNCTGRLDNVIHSFLPLLRPGGMATLVIMPRFCLWETLLLFRGKFAFAFRRFNSKNGVTAYVEGVPFTCWYYSPEYVRRCAGNDFDVLAIETLCSMVPPSYMENFPVKMPRLYRWLVALEQRFKKSSSWSKMGDYYIITLRKK